MIDYKTVVTLFLKWLAIYALSSIIETLLCIGISRIDFWFSVFVAFGVSFPASIWLLVVFEYNKKRN